MRAAAAARRIVGADPLDDDDGDVTRRARRVAQDTVAADAIRRALQCVVAVRQLDDEALRVLHDLRDEDLGRRLYSMIRAELQTKDTRLGIEGRRALEGAGQPVRKSDRRVYPQAGGQFRAPQVDAS